MTDIMCEPLLDIFYSFAAFYISLKRHKPTNTYGIAPAIVITRSKSKYSKSGHPKTADSNLYSNTSDMLSVSAAHSDWSIYTAEPSNNDQHNTSNNLSVTT